MLSDVFLTSPLLRRPHLFPARPQLPTKFAPMLSIYTMARCFSSPMGSRRRLHFWGAVGYNFKSELIEYDAGNSNGKMNHKTYINYVLEPIVSEWLVPTHYSRIRTLATVRANLRTPSKPRKNHTVWSTTTRQVWPFGDTNSTLYGSLIRI